MSPSSSMNSSQLESERLTVSHEIIDRKKLIRRLILLRFSLSFLSFSRCRLDATGRIRKGKEILASNARRYAKSRESPVTSALLGLPLSASSAGGGEAREMAIRRRKSAGSGIFPVGGHTLTQIETREKISRLMN